MKENFAPEKFSFTFECYIASDVFFIFACLLRREWFISSSNQP